MYNEFYRITAEYLMFDRHRQSNVIFHHDVKALLIFVFFLLQFRRFFQIGHAVGDPGGRFLSK